MTIEGGQKDALLRRAKYKKKKKEKKKVMPSLMQHCQTQQALSRSEHASRLFFFALGIPK